MIVWSPDPVAIHLGPLTLRWYGLCFLAAFTVGTQLVKRMCRLEHRNFAELESLIAYVILGTVIGARLGHCLFYEPDYFLAHPIEILKVWNGGLASHGGALGVFVALVAYSRKYPQFGIWWLMDRISIVATVAGGFIRIGNLMNSEIIGKPATVPWAFIFSRVDQVPRHPTQVYESLSYFLIAGLSWLAYKRDFFRGRRGFLLGMNIALIFAIRFLLEIFKENQESFENRMALNLGQIFSIPFILVGAFLVIRALRQPNKVARP